MRNRCVPTNIWYESSRLAPATMAPKKIYSNQRFAEIAAESAAKARATYPNSLSMHLSCEHLPEFDKAFCHNDGKLRRDTPLTSVGA